MRNKFLSLNRQLIALPLVSLLISVDQALALFSTAKPSSSPVQTVDVSKPTTVVGNGTQSSCTESAFTNAIAKGGIITFNCGSSPYTLVLSSEKIILTLPRLKKQRKYEKSKS